MSTLTPSEKAKFERLLNMGNGYVSSFSDATFATFVAEAVELDIHSAKYTSKGTSKAKKLREFWRVEPDNLVADLLDGLIDHQAEFESDEQLLEDCRAIVARMRSAGSHVKALKMQSEIFDAPHLAKAITRIEKYIEADPELAIGSAKELLETCCKTILCERGIEVPTNPELPKLTKATFGCLDLLPDGVENERRGSDAIKNVLRSFGTITQGVAELRNLYGTGHGKHGNSTPIQPRHARLVVAAASSLSMFLLETHEYKK